MVKTSDNDNTKSIDEVKIMTQIHKQNKKGKSIKTRFFYKKCCIAHKNYRK